MAVISRKTVSSQVFERLLELFMLGGLDAGDRLPTEKELMKRFGVGRSSVREAMKVMEIIGLVGSRAGDGTYVRSSHNRIRLVDWILHLSLAEDDFDTMTEARVAFEQTVILLAIRKGTHDDLLLLSSIVENMERAEDFERLVELDLRFHRSLVQMTRNTVVAKFQAVLDVFFERGESPDDSFPVHRSNMVQLHREIVKALETKDSRRAQELVETHILGLGPSLPGRGDRAL